MTPYFCPITHCADCDATQLVVDEAASDLICADGTTLVLLPVPTPGLLHNALRVSRSVQTGESTDPKDLLIHELAGGLFLALELLNRVSLYGIDGTGDDEADDSDLDAALKATHDLIRGIGNDRKDFTDIQIDISNALCFFDEPQDSIERAFASSIVGEA